MNSLNTNRNWPRQFGLWFAALAAATTMALSGCGSDNEQTAAAPSTPAVPPAPLAAPAVVSNTATASAVNLTWPAVRGAQSYKVFRCEVPSNGPAIDPCATSAVSTCGNAVATVTTNAFTDRPTAAVDSCYRVQACTDSTGSGCGAFSVTSLGGLVIPVPGAVAFASVSDFSVHAGQNVSLTSRAENVSGTVAFEWEQISGPKVVLQGANSANASFVAPAVAGPNHELVAFKLNVRDARGPGEAGKTSVTIEPVANLVLQATTKARKALVGDTVSLHAHGSGAVTPVYAWTQLSPATPVVTLTSAATANPSFVAPDNVPSVFVFQVTYRDSTTGRFAVDQTSVEIKRASTQGSGQPLGLSLPDAATVPAQSLQLQAGADGTVVSGQTTRLGVGVTGGTAPYTWRWTQVSGPAASLTGATGAVLVVAAPSVTNAQALVFKVDVSDSAGQSRSASVGLRVITPPAVASAGTVVPAAPTYLPPVQVTPGTTLTIGTGLTNPVVTQTAGPVLMITPPTQVTQGTPSLAKLTAPPLLANLAPAEIVITGTNNAGVTVTQIQPVLVIRTPPLAAAPVAPPQIPVAVPPLYEPMSVGSCGIDRADEGQAGALLCATARGGNGVYTFNWVLQNSLPALPNGQTISLRDATTSHPSFNAPSVDAKTILTFLVTATDGSQSATELVYLTINNTAPDLTVGTVADLVVPSGQRVLLSAPAPVGGLPPYTYAVVQTSGASVGALPGRNPAFPAPTIAAGGADLALGFEWTITDGYGNQAKATERVTIKAPAAPLLATLTGPGPTDQGSTVSLNTRVAGGTPPYTYRYTVAGGTLAVPAVANPSVTLPSIAAGGAKQRLTITLAVTDNASPPITSTALPFTIEVNPPAASAALVAASQCQVCGNYESGRPCTRLDIIRGSLTQCSADKPYCMNDIKQLAGQPAAQIIKRCASRADAFQQWYTESSDKVACFRYDPNIFNDDVICHLACSGDGCNRQALPPKDTLFKP
jgi:hypothetical protein